jgi:hypothetical protein
MPDPSFIFQGTVIAVRDSTVPMVVADDLTARVRVDRVLRAPVAMEQLVGREITVQLSKAAPKGTEAIFSADGWLYGESLAVVETGKRRSAAQSPVGIAAEVADRSLDARESPASRDRAASFRQGLRERTATASRVVVGRVVAVRLSAAASAQSPGRLTEHDPNWTEATVEVDQAVKGRAPRSIKVLFANSEDVMWRDAPKLAVGQKAVMLLHRAPPGAGTRADAVLEQLDVQPADSADVVASLIEGGQASGDVRREAER